MAIRLPSAYDKKKPVLYEEKPRLAPVAVKPLVPLPSVSVPKKEIPAYVPPSQRLPVLYKPLTLEEFKTNTPEGLAMRQTALDAVRENRDNSTQAQMARRMGNASGFYAGSEYLKNELSRGVMDTVLNTANTIGGAASRYKNKFTLPDARDGKLPLASKKEDEKKYAEGASEYILNSAATKQLDNNARRSAELYDLTDKSGLTKFSGELSYNIGHMLPSVLATAATGGAGAPAALGQLISSGIISASTYSSAIRQAISEGASAQDAASYALLSSFVEGAGEQLIGGAAGLGKGIIDGALGGALTKLTEKITNPALRAAGSYMLKNVIGEGIEEGIQELGDTLAKRATYDRNAKVDWGQVGGAALMGGAIGALFGVSEIPESYRGAVAAREGAKINTSPGAVQALINDAQGSPDVSGFASELDAKRRAGGDITNEEIGALSMMNDAVKLRGLQNDYNTAAQKVASEFENDGLVMLPKAEVQYSVGDVKFTQSDLDAGINSVAHMQPVIKISGEEYKKSEIDLATQVGNYFNAIGNVARSPQLGNVTLDINGVKDDIAHGIGRVKAASFAAVPMIIEQGKIIDFQTNWKNRSYDTAVVAAPIVIGEKPYIGGVVLIRNNGANRFYLHEVLTEENGALPFKTGTSVKNISTPGGNAPSVISLLQKVKDVKYNSQKTDAEFNVHTQYSGDPSASSTPRKKTAPASDNSITQSGDAVNTLYANGNKNVTTVPRLVLPKAGESQAAYTGRMWSVSPDDIAVAERLGAKLGRETAFYYSAGPENGYYSDGKIYINTASENPVLATFAHELTHSVEGVKAYTGLRDYVTGKLGDGIDAARAEMVERYAKHGITLDGTSVDTELVAEYLQKNLMTDEAAINSLVKRDRSLGQRIKDWLEGIITKLTGTPEQREARRVRDMYAKALDQSDAIKSAKTEYSISTTADPETVEELRGKAKDAADRAARTLARDMTKLLSVKYGDMQSFLLPSAQEIAAEYWTSGKISPETLDRVFEEAYNRGIVDNEAYLSENDEVRAAIHSTALTLGERNMHDIGDYEAFRKRNFGTLRLKNEGGMPVDSFYTELAEMSPSLFPENITHPADQLRHIAEVAQKLKRAEYDLDTYYGSDAPMFKESARRDFERSISDYTTELDKVKRYVNDANARAEKREAGLRMVSAAGDTPAERSDTAKTLKKFYDEVSKQRKEVSKVVQRIMLTDADNAVVEQLLAGSITPDKLADVENRADILQVYEAKKKLAAAESPIKRYNAGRKEGLAKQADESIGNIMRWDDKKSGLLYERETFERNIRDIAPDKETADRMIATYRTPIMKNEQAAILFKDDLRNRVRNLRISDKIIKGNEVSESAAVQFIGEYDYILRSLEKKPRGKKDLHGKTYEDYANELRNFEAANPKLDFVAVRKKANKMSAIYDELYGRLNDARILNGYAPIEYRKGYFPHFNDVEPDTLLAKIAAEFGFDTSLDSLPTTIAGLTQNFKPGKKWESYALERKGTETTYDALKGFDRYIETAADVIFHTDDLQRLRTLGQEIRLATADDKIKQQASKILADETLTQEQQYEQIIDLFKNGKYQLKGFVNSLDEYTNILAGKKSKLDRVGEERLGRGFYQSMKKLESRVAANMVALNPGSWLTNFIPLHQAAAQVDNKYMVRGMFNTLKAFKNSDMLENSSAFLVNRRGSDPIVLSMTDQASKLLSMPMTYIDTFTAGSVVRARYYQNRDNGMDINAALTEADSFASSVMAGRAKGDMPTLFAAKNPLTKLFTQFQLEVNNELSYIFKDLPREQKDKGVLAVAASLMKYAVGAYLFNEWYEELVGRRAAFDVLGIVNDTVGDMSGYELPNIAGVAVDTVKNLKLPGPEIFKTKKVGTSQAIGNLGGEISQNLPFVGGLLGGGRLPVSAAIPDIPKLITTGANYADGKITLPKVADTAGRELVKPAAYLLPPFGGGQVLKTVSGIDAVAKGGTYATDNDGNKNLQFPVANDNLFETASNYAKGALFGKMALPGARDWVKGGFGSKSPEFTAAYQELGSLGISNNDAFAVLNKISDTKLVENKLAALTGSGISASGRAVIFKHMIASDKETSVMNMLEISGEDPGNIYSALYKLRTAKENKNMNLSDVKRQQLENTALTDKSKAYIYRNILATDTEEKLFMVLDGLGENAVKSYKLISALHKADKTVKKYSVIAESGMTDESKAAVFKNVATEAVVNRFNTAQAYGVTVDTWAKFYKVLDIFGAGDSVSQANAEKALRLIPISTMQKAALWQLANKSWKAASNPFSPQVGEAVVAAMNGRVLLPALGGTLPKAGVALPKLGEKSTLPKLGGGVVKQPKIG